MLSINFEHTVQLMQCSNNLKDLFLLGENAHTSKPEN